jgi:hypothetical protein
VALRARVRRLSLSLEGRRDLPASRAVGTATIETVTTLVALAPCVHQGPLEACAVGALGSFEASSNGVRQPRSDASFHATAGLRAGAELAVGSRFILAAHLDAAFALTPQTVQLDGVDVYSLPVASAGAGALAMWRFF